MNNQMPYGFNPNMSPNLNPNMNPSMNMPTFPGNHGFDENNGRINLLEQKVENLENRINKMEKKIMGTVDLNNDNLYNYQSSMHMM